MYSVSIALIAGLVVYLLQNTWNLYNACTNATLSNQGHQVTFPPQYGQSAADSKVSRLDSKSDSYPTSLGLAGIKTRR